MTRLLSIGECMIEMAPTGDDTYAMGFAGDTFNTAWYARRLAGPDVEVAYFSAVGDDTPSDQLTEFVQQAGIVPELVRRRGKSVGLYMISLKNGERSFSYWRDASAARTLADDLECLPDLNAGDIAYFSGITMAILSEEGRERLLTSLGDARSKGVLVAFDPNLRPRLWKNTDAMRDWIMQAAGVAEIALPSFEDEKDIFGDRDIGATAERYGSAGVGTVVVKDGPGPVLLRVGGTDQIIATQAATAVVDTTAAGDSFNAGFLVGVLSGRSESDAVVEGCAVARQVIGARGALVEI